jgi:hypothetical protein
MFTLSGASLADPEQQSGFGEIEPAFDALHAPVQPIHPVLETNEISP